MSTELITIMVGLITTIGAWMVGRKKNNADVASAQVQAINSLREFYESVLKDTKNQLSTYIQATEQNRKDIQRLIVLVDILTKKACIKNKCRDRVYLSKEQTDMIVDQNELLDINNTNEINTK